MRQILQLVLVSSCVLAGCVPKQSDAPASETAAPPSAAAPAATTGGALSKPPDWATDAVWYQVFVERFHNGDPSNDPRPVDIEGTYPGFIPDGWHITRWTQDWYQPDVYAGEVLGRPDENGNPIEGFNQPLGLRRYGGDLQGVFDKLDYLQELGVTAIYFNPLNDAPSLHKFDARHWRHIDRNFGPTPDRDIELIASETPDDPSTWVMTGADQQFVELIAELHRRGIRVILDISFNHTGHRFWAWRDVVEKQKTSKYADWYWIRQFDDPETAANEFEYRGWFGVPSLPEIRETVYVDHAEKIEPFDGDVASAAAKAHIFAVTRRWLDPNGDGDPSDGIDGFRLDVAAEMPLGFWREWRRHVRSTNPAAYLVGEVWWEKWPDELLDPAPFLQGDVFDAVMNYRWYRAARQFFAKAPPKAFTPSQFVETLRSLETNLPPEANYAMMNMSASHDTPRLSTSLFNRDGKYKVSGPDYRIHKPDDATRETQRLLLAHQFTYVGAPQIWAGDEMGMWGADDPHNRKPLTWPELKFDPERGHPDGKKRPVDEVAFDRGLFEYYKKLVAIRKAHPALNRGAIDFLLVDDDNDVLAYRRTDGNDEVVAVFNNSGDAQTIRVPVENAASYRDVLDKAFVQRDGEYVTLRLPGRRAAILAKRGVQ